MADKAAGGFFLFRLGISQIGREKKEFGSGFSPATFHYLPCMAYLWQN